jgi:hypothetical protein
MPIWGITASAMSGHLSSFESIATVTGSGSASSITFSSIPATTYTHLQIRATVFTTSNGYGLACQANGDGGSNYTYHRLSGDGSATFAGGAASQSYTQFFGYAQGTDTTYPTVFVLDILDAFSANKYKTFRILVGEDKNGSGEVGLFSGVWMSSSAISSLTILSGMNFSTNSKFALYGVKA